MKKKIPLNFGSGPVILLFYDGFERRARRNIILKTSTDFRRIARFCWRYMKGKQLRTGFYTQFLHLVDALKLEGCDVHINDYRLAEKFPNYPVGAAGYPTILNHLPKTNPMLFGPGDFGSPTQFPAILKNYNVKGLLCFCEWIREIYQEPTHQRVVQWFAGILPEEENMGGGEIDCLIYDKIRWHRDELEVSLVSPIRKFLDQKGLTHKTVRYGEYMIDQYRDYLKNSKTMIFLCEHETQGLAYQEAMAFNLPILAWDEGILCDQDLKKYARPDLKVTSVPYFSHECGLRFKMNNFDSIFQYFWEQRAKFNPKKFVSENLSPAISAQIYLDAYFKSLRD